jgi:hypothetical protein
MDTESEIAMIIQDTIESAKLPDDKKCMAVYTAMQIITALFRDDCDDNLWSSVPNFSEKIKDINMEYTIYRIARKQKCRKEISIFSSKTKEEDIISILEMLFDAVTNASNLFNKFENEAMKESIPNDSILQYKIGMKDKHSKIYLEIEAECERDIFSFIYTLNTLLTYILIMHECCLIKTKRFYDEKMHNEVLDAKQFLRCSNISYKLKKNLVAWAEIEKNFIKRIGKIIEGLNKQNKKG